MVGSISASRPLFWSHIGYGLMRGVYYRIMGPSGFIHEGASVLTNPKDSYADSKLIPEILARFISDNISPRQSRPSATSLRPIIFMPRVKRDLP